MSTFDLTLKPAQTELLAQPGVSLTQAYEITNNSSSSLLLTSSVLPWQPLGTDGSLTYDQVPTNPYFSFSLANSDLQLGQTFLLRPHSTRQLVLKIKSAIDTPQTDGYFTFFISQNLTTSLNPDTNLSTAARLGSHLLISTSTTDHPASKAHISRFSISPIFKDVFFPKLNFQAEISNLSPYFFKTSGQIIISKNNLTLQELSLFPQNILANSSRTIFCNQNNLPVNCSFTPPFWPGKYQATLVLDPSLSTPPSSLTFYVFPYSLILLILLPSLFLLVFKHFRH